MEMYCVQVRSGLFREREGGREGKIHFSYQQFIPFVDCCLTKCMSPVSLVFHTIIT